MPIKKKKIYSSLCAVCDALRGIMVAELEKLEFKITKVDQLKQGIIQELSIGKIRFL
jgi:hypothetical protein